MNSSVRPSFTSSFKNSTSIISEGVFICQRHCDSLLHAGGAEHFLLSIPSFFLTWISLLFNLLSPVLLSNLPSLTQHCSSEFPRNMNRVMRIIKAGPGCGPTSLKNREQWNEMFSPDLLFITTSFVWSLPPPFIFLHTQHFCTLDSFTDIFSRPRECESCSNHSNLNRFSKKPEPHSRH